MNLEEMEPRESQQRDTRKKMKCKKSGQDFEIRGEEMERERHSHVGCGVYQTMCVFVSVWEFLLEGQTERKAETEMRLEWEWNYRGSGGKIQSWTLESVSLHIFFLTFSTTMDKRAKWGNTVQTRLEKLTWRQTLAHIFVRKGLTAEKDNTFSGNFQKRELFSIEIWNAEHWSVQTSDAFVRIRHQHSVSLAPSHSSLLLQLHQMALCFPNHELFLRAYLLLTVDEHPDSNFQGSLSCEAMVCTSCPSAETTSPQQVYLMLQLPRILLPFKTCGVHVHH